MNGFRRDQGNNGSEHDGDRKNARTTGTPKSIKVTGSRESRQGVLHGRLRSRRGAVVVNRAVYDAGMKLETEVDGGADGPAFSNAEDKATSCRAVGDTAGAAFWDETFRFLMTRECLAAGTETIIIEPGETYDYEEERVIRAGTNQPRSDKDYR
jgi:hypothetical protein